MTITCPSCGEETPEGFPRCANCGASLAAEPLHAREERKVVTVLFCDLVGFTGRAESMDPEDVRALLSGYHERVRHELERHGGTVEKFVGDAVMALFGAPTAHEDDPERAARAAVAIRDWAREGNDLQVRIGITTGEALVSLHANRDRGEGMASGDVVNTASRLQAAAGENAILVDETTYRATRHVVAYGAGESVVAKGKAESVPVWQALEARSRFGVDTFQPGAALVGRERELDRLVDALASARAERSCQLLTLIGVPGIGKSRLVFELSRIADAEPELITWRQGRSLPYGEGVTFWTLSEMIKAEAGILETHSTGEAEQRLQAAVADVVADASDARWVESHLRPLVGLGGHAEPGDRTERFAAWRRFLEALAERRATVLVFEDLHWADDDLLDFVDYLVDWATDVPLLCVCTARAELLDRRPGWSGGKPNAATLRLAPLSDDDTGRLVRALLERAALPAERERELLAHAGGNPLYAEQFARLAAERSGAGDLALPETVQGIIAARLDALTPDEKALLQDAAAVGKVFWLGALAHLDDVQAHALEQRLHALERKEFVRRERRPSIAGEREYAFRHLLVRDVAYAQLPRASRAAKHRRLAGWIEALAPDRSEDKAEMLAHHYVAALELSRAAGLDVDDLVDPARAALVEAGDRAMSLSALEPARRFYSDALELTSEDHAERPYVLLRRVRSLAGTVREETVAALEAAIPVLRSAGDSEGVAEAEAALANAFFVRGRRAEADEHAARANALIAGAPPSDATLSVLAERSRLLMVAGDAEEALRVGREGLAAAEAFGGDHFRAQLLVTIGASRTITGDFDGRVDIEEGLALATAARMPSTIHRGYINLAEVRSRMGSVDDASEAIAAARRSNTRYGNESGLLWVLGEEAHLSYLLGHWEAALASSEELLDRVRNGPSHYHEPSCHAVISSVRLARDDVKGAVGEIERAFELARSRRDPQLLSPVAAMRGQILTAAGASAAERAVADALAVPLDFRACVPLAWAFVDLELPGELRPRLDELRTPVWARVATAILDGELVEAAERLARTGDETDTAYARLRSGRDDEVRRALDFYRSVGATRYIREGEALLAKTA